MKELMKRARQQKLNRLSENAAKASATPSADSLDEAKLFLQESSITLSRAPIH
jgi:hypothetical protein